MARWVPSEMLILLPWRVLVPLIVVALNSRPPIIRIIIFKEVHLMFLRRSAGTSGFKSDNIQIESRSITGYFHGNLADTYRAEGLILQRERKDQNVSK